MWRLLVITLRTTLLPNNLLNCLFEDIIAFKEVATKKVKTEPYVHQRWLGLHYGIFFRTRDASGTFSYGIRFAFYRQMRESEIIASRFGRVSGDFESVMWEYCFVHEWKFSDYRMYANACESKYPECNKSRNIYEPGKISSDANLGYNDLNIPLEFPPVCSFLCFSNNYEPGRVGIYTSVQCTSHELPHLENPLVARQ